jgi:hypothetical protein
MNVRKILVRLMFVCLCDIICLHQTALQREPVFNLIDSIFMDGGGEHARDGAGKRLLISKLKG